jgi:hypothetical protein
VRLRILRDFAATRNRYIAWSVFLYLDILHNLLNSSQVIELLDLEQKAASLQEARAATQQARAAEKHAKAANKQGKMVVVFTAVTVIFVG